MSARPGFAARPGGADAWVQAAPAPAAPSKAEVFTARLTVDLTPELRGRIKVAAFRQGMTVAEMLRGLLEAQFPPEPAP